ncbi:DUF4397 domain-containing protein [Mucilaginibacter myungsuensis]|uniref:DUF4397 domain-containing protein n=1 Tax=Mucilaginibacter myungsuensis TaxID=649104 RepID=A0A929L548_9SPHI|nr:DUF4397 domain-containing protein [Mucilaginibacter myungsuensis]MBE9664185.1 DUF4397 domain-containing protein [Mucilaginibacter myungsuensis]MDN3599888.1 DUF4397 domain-containing protein [Mucilaginibacter myungsuensis]
MKQFTKARTAKFVYLFIALIGIAAIQSCKKPSPDAEGGVGSAKLRLVNTSPDAGSSKIILEEEVGVTGSVGTGNASSYINAFAGEQQVTVQSGAGTVLARVSNQLDANSYYSFYLTGVSGSYSLFPVLDDVAAVSGKAKVRFVQTSSQLNSANLSAGSTSLFTAQPFKAITNSVEVAPGAYTFNLSNGVTAITLASSQSVTLTSGKNYTVFVSTQSVSGNNATLALNVVASN